MTSRLDHILVFGWLLVAVALTSADARAEKRVALVVGNANYQHVARLDNPANDAKLMADTLRGLGFALIGNGALLNLDKSAFEAAVQRFGQQLQGADIALFYYAGHGLALRGTNYLVPVSANPTREADVDFQMIDVNLVLRQMEGAGTRLNVVMLDACRNNPFGGRGLRAAIAGLAQIQAAEGTLISYATQPNNVAQDGSDGDSPYTKALVQTIRRPGLNIFETFNEVGLAVKRATGGSQQPWLSSSPIDGNFYFVPPTGAAAAATSTPGPSAEEQEAGRVWTVIQNTGSVAVLEDFIRQFGSTVFGSMARARMDELKRVQAAALDRERRSAAELETERQRRAAEEAERQRRAAEEAERQRRAAEQAEQQRRQIEEAERQRLAALTTPSGVDRFGAVAISTSSLAWGEGHNYGSLAQAESRALLECAKRATDCRVVQWTRNACLALAIGVKAWGHSWSPDANMARSNAIANCRKYGENCTIAYSGCSLPQ